MDNWGSLASLLNMVGRQSMLKLLTAKYSLKTRRKLLKNHAELKLLLPHISYGRPKKRFSTSRVNDRVKVMFAKYKSMSKLKDLVCNKCGSNYKVEMHHIKPMRKRNKLKSKYDESFHNRKQVPLCRVCHMKQHKGIV